MSAARTQHRWTSYEDACLRVLHGMGYTDKQLAPIMGFHRHAVRRARRRLELPANKRPASGWTHSEETRARLSAAQQLCWREGRRVYPPLPPKGTPERRHYEKVKDALGMAAARAAIAGGVS